MVIHEIAIDTLMLKYPTMLKNKFKKKLNKILLKNDFSADVLGAVNRFNRRPDCFRVCENKYCKAIHVYEVEDSNKISDYKMTDYAWLWFDLVGDYWDLFLYSVNRYGKITDEIDLRSYYYSILNRRMAS